MAGLSLVCLILAGILVLQATAVKSEENPVEAKVQMGAEPTGAASRIADQPTSTTAESLSDESREAEAPAAVRRLGKHKSSDKSVAGGGVIIGGLITVTFAAVFCYIRVTRRKDANQCGR